MDNLTSIFKGAQAASRTLNLVSEEKINALLLDLADRTERESKMIIEANAKDLARMDPKNPMLDRLMLNEERLKGIAADLRSVAALPSPVGHTLGEWTRPNGMKITKVSVPFGVIGVIYEARPNVGFDVFALCLKSGNATILKGGSDAADSNAAIVSLIKESVKKAGLDENIVTLMPNDRSATAALLEAVGYVDLVIPRGSRSLIDFVRDTARVPVIETGAGVCHTYFDLTGNTAMGADIIFNAKTRRVSVCNALDGVIIHRARLAELYALCERLATKNVEIFADPESYAALDGKYPAALLKHADEEYFGIEFMDYKMSIKTVGSVEEAIEHVTLHSSKHSETIVTEDSTASALYNKMVDAACVYTNVSTAFTDGGQFGFGAEIGISTQKLHARGPMALPELTTYKYIISGDGQVRS